MRTLYQKYLQWAPARCGAWCKYAEVEHSLGELPRARAIYELAIEQPLLDMPEALWKVLLPFPSAPSLPLQVQHTSPAHWCDSVHAGRRGIAVAAAFCLLHSL